MSTDSEGGRTFSLTLEDVKAYEEAVALHGEALRSGHTVQAYDSGELQGGISGHLADDAEANMAICRRKRDRILAATTDDVRALFTVRYPEASN